MKAQVYRVFNRFLQMPVTVDQEIPADFLRSSGQVKGYAVGFRIPIG